MKKARRIDMDTKKLRQKILDLAIRGKLVPQDPNDEPASVLLERIRAEKERLIKEGKIKRSKKSTSDTPHYENDVPFEVPESWEWVRLSDIAYFGGGKTPSMDEKRYWQNGRNLWVTSKDMKCDRISNSLLKISDEALAIMTQYNPGTLLMVTRSGILRHSLPIALLEKNATVNQDLKTISFYKGDIAEYIFYAIKANEKFILKEYHKDGTTVDSINFEKFVDILLPLPPQNEQQRIIKSLHEWLGIAESLEIDKEQLQSVINNTKSKILDLAIHGKLVPQDPNDEPAIELLRRINPSFVPCDNAHYENVPSNWTLARAEDIGMLLSGRDLTNDECNSEKKGLPYLIGASNIEGNTFSFIRWTEKPQVISQIEDILISCKGTIGAIVKNNIGDMHIARQFMAIRPNTNCIISDYLHICLIAAIEEIKKDARGVIPGIARDDILSKVFTIPPLNEQRRIIAALKQYYSILDNISANL